MKPRAHAVQLAHPTSLDRSGDFLVRVGGVDRHPRRDVLAIAAWAARISRRNSWPRIEASRQRDRMRSPAILWLDVLPRTPAQW